MLEASLLIARDAARDAHACLELGTAAALLTPSLWPSRNR
jgi:hypothetical protein